MTTVDVNVDDFLEHFGVGGMRWGQRNSARSQNRALNKASRANDKAAFVNNVNAARARMNSGGIKKDWIDSKVQFSQDKVTMGSREARKIMNQKKINLNNEVYTSRQAKNGKEVAGVLLVAAGSVALLSAVSRMH